MESTQPGTAYPLGQLAAAFVTATTHEDPATRARAGKRVERWSRVLAGMASGRVRVGSRTPMAGYPAWVTPTVVKGGFATGEPVAGGPLRPQETALGDLRGRVFAHFLTDAGQAELCALLDSGAYRLSTPEEAALLVVAWLLRAGDRSGALGVLDSIGPFADRLCFVPSPGPVGEQDPEVLWRSSAGEVGAALAGRRPNERVEAMREALAVWNPLADEFLSLWLSAGFSSAGPSAADDEWRERATALLARYDRLAGRYTRCRKHRNPKENLAVLRSAARHVVAGKELAPRQAGLLRHVITSMVARRGRPGSAGHTALRDGQARIASIPGRHRLARVVVSRIAALDPDSGIRDVAAVCAPVTAAEAATHGIPAGTPIPDEVRQVVRRAQAGPVDELVRSGAVPSAEVLAELVPQLAARTSAAAYPDEAVERLVAASYRAFRVRRSLLLVDLAHQVRLSELPWIDALRPHRQAGDGTRQEAFATLRRLGELAVDGFPATLLPNPLIRELAALSTEAGRDLPWVEQLAADIFTGWFTPKFVRAADLAGELLAGSLYARYYDIEYSGLRRQDFGERCHARAGVARSGRLTVGENGMVIEQAQILTSHNLATLVHAVGVVPADGWAPVARRTFASVVRLSGRDQRDLAYAWRQLIFFLSLPGVDASSVVEQCRTDLAAAPVSARSRLEAPLNDLAGVVTGGRLTREQQLLGWAARR
ncbi:hypothetical protein [Actinoplanes sp. NBRC 101535]|uniref:hypothetical protein n=1 Tax=Actinoplanes sp. NBRC 101535 TaxID=3032196 RepID=UPI0024A59B5D|nr:hypothetical protein [Actinoplanes sp. NBRC 101535]GLY03189.1 hypothetical protein Acsp01_35680 [Actinoplanes sp. NBRC 101535]